MEGYIIEGDRRLKEAYIYEGERIAVEYPNGQTVEIPPNKVHMMLTKGRLPSGEPCHILMEKSPMTRLPIVVLEEKEKVNG